MHGNTTAPAIEDGFVASARVVVAAAMIMFAVFAAFVPEGEGADQDRSPSAWRSVSSSTPSWSG